MWSINGKSYIGYKQGNNYINLCGGRVSFGYISTVEKNNFIFHKGIIWKPTIIFQSIIDNHHFWGDINTVELHILIILVQVGRNLNKTFINIMIWIIFPF